MGQRNTPASATNSTPLKVSVFATPLGYWGLLGRDDVLFGLTLGHSQARLALAAFANPFDGHPVEQQACDWNPALRQRLERYSAGERVTFEDVQLKFPHLTPFQQQIIKLTRRVPHGKTISYGELAAKAKHPRAARAVGTVMKSNRFPIIVPCHRVVASGGNLGGYSAPQGLTLKTRLLELEQA